MTSEGKKENPLEDNTSDESTSEENVSKVNPLKDNDLKENTFDENVSKKDNSEENVSKEDNSEENVSKEDNSEENVSKEDNSEENNSEENTSEENSSEETKKQSKEKPKIIEIGRNGRIEKYSTISKNENNYEMLSTRSGSEIRFPKIGYRVKARKTSKKRILEKEIYEFYKWELNDEIINADLQYFLTFCSLLYAIRALFVFYGVIIKSDNIKQLSTYGLTSFWTELAFSLTLFANTFTGYMFAWKMFPGFAIPYLISLIATTFVIAFKFILQIIFINRLIVDLKGKRIKSIAFNKRVVEIVLDITFLTLNLFISFLMTSLYEQMSETERMIKYEPESFTIDGKAYRRAVVDKQVVYRQQKVRQKKVKK